MYIAQEIENLKLQKQKKNQKRFNSSSGYQRRGYNTSHVYNDSEYHYASDFGDESSDKYNRHQR